MLHGQRDEIMQGGVLVTVQCGGIGEARRKFILPGLTIPGLGRGIGKFFELPGDAAHIGGRAENNAVSGGNLGPVGFGNVTCCGNGNELGLCARHIRHAGGNMFRHFCGVAIT